MAKQIVTLLTDDIDGSEADRTVEFGLDGVNYTIDLSEKNAGKLRKALDPYLAAASRVGRTAPAASPARHALPRRAGRTGTRTRPSGNGLPRTATRCPSGAASRARSSRPSTASAEPGPTTRRS